MALSLLRLASTSPPPADPSFSRTALTICTSSSTNPSTTALHRCTSPPSPPTPSPSSASPSPPLLESPTGTPPPLISRVPVAFSSSTLPSPASFISSRRDTSSSTPTRKRTSSTPSATGQAKKKVMFMGEAAFKVRCEAIESASGAKELILEHLTRRLADAHEMEDEEEATAEREEVEPEMKKAKRAIAALKKFLADVTRDWTVEENRVIGHVTLSPPITLNYGNDGFTDDWAVVQIESSMIAKFNLVDNAIDLDSVDVDELTAWMYPHPANLTSFEYPTNRSPTWSPTRRCSSPTRRTRTTTTTRSLWC